jgi:hypothetical protein
MRTLGEVMMIAAALACLAVAVAAGYGYLDSPPPALPGPRSRVGAPPLRVTALAWASVRERPLTRVVAADSRP